MNRPLDAIDSGGCWPENPGRSRRNVDCRYVRENIRSLGGIGVEHGIVTATVTVAIDELRTSMSSTT
jgi:hypothetical protein